MTSAVRAGWLAVPGLAFQTKPFATTPQMSDKLLWTVGDVMLWWVKEKSNIVGDRIAKSGKVRDVFNCN